MPKRHVFEEIGPHAQNMQHISGSITNIIWEDLYDHSTNIRIFQKTVNLKPQPATSHGHLPFVTNAHIKNLCTRGGREGISEPLRACQTLPPRPFDLAYD